jgi:hypothetical protein
MAPLLLQALSGIPDVHTGDSVWSCAAVGNCSADGFYTDNSDHAQAFVVSKL